MKKNLRALNDSSIGLRLGEYGGRNKRIQPVKRSNIVKPYENSICTCLPYFRFKFLIVVDMAVVENDD